MVSQNTKADHFVLRFGHENHITQSPITVYYDERKIKQFRMIVWRVVHDCIHKRFEPFFVSFALYNTFFIWLPFFIAPPYAAHS